MVVAAWFMAEIAAHAKVHTSQMKEHEEKLARNQKINL